MTRRPICALPFWCVLVASSSLGFLNPIGPTKVWAAQGVSAAQETKEADSRTNEFPKILQAQEELLRAVSQIREQTESAAQRNAEALQKLREDTTAAMQETRNEFAKSSIALEELLAHQLQRQVDSFQEMNRSTVVAFGGLACLGLVALLALSFVLWRATRQMANVGWAQAQVRIGPGVPKPEIAGDQAKSLPDKSNEPDQKMVLASIQKLESLEKRLAHLEHEAGSSPARGNAVEPTAADQAASDAAGNESTELGKLLAEGQALLKSGRPQDALERFLRALRADPTSAEAALRKGNALEQLGRLNEALAAYNEAIAADPALNAAYLRKGGLCNRLGRLDEAFQSFERVLQTLEKPRGG
jgi:tetratricopeptide (TPR) repeat protein